MKSFNHIFDKVIDYDNIDKAIMRASLGKRERPEVQRVLANKDRYIKRLQYLLHTQSLIFSKHKAMQIFDGINHKKRYIVQPHFIYDQIVHHAVIQAMSEVLTRGMYEFSCGSVPDKGSIKGKRYIEKFIKNPKNKSEIKYIIKLDIKHFFQSVNPEILKARFRKYIHDDKMIWLLDMIAGASLVSIDGVDANVGLPIGYYTSQWFANWFLQDLDHFIKEQLHAKCYVRYMDDIVIFGRNKKKLHKDIEEIRNFLKKIDLEIKANYQVFRFDYIDHRDGKRKGRPLDFMGFKFYRDKTTLRKGILLKALRKARRIEKKKSFSWFEACQMISYMGWFRHTDTYSLFLSRIKPRVSIRVCRNKIRERQRAINKEKNHGDNLQRGRKSSKASYSRNR